MLYLEVYLPKLPSNPAPPEKLEEQSCDVLVAK